MGINSGFKGLTCEITLHVAQIVNTEKLQRYIPWKHGWFIVNVLHKRDQ